MIAKKFQHLVCDDSHRHSHHDRNSRLALCSWPTGLQQKIDMSIVDLIGEGKRALFASGTGAVSASDSPERARLFRTNLFERHVFVCHGCQEKHAKGMRTHNRKSDCKWKDVPVSQWEQEWKCPGCSHKRADGLIIGKPRGHSSHTYKDDCRLTTIVPRNTSSHPREAPVPIGQDPSGNASAPDIPEVDLPPQDNTSGPSSGSAETSAEPRATRRPDKQERFPETPKSIDSVDTDWSKFNIDKASELYAIEWNTSRSLKYANYTYGGGMHPELPWRRSSVQHRCHKR